MYKHKSNSNYFVYKSIILPVVCITVLGLVLSSGRISKLSATCSQGNNKVPDGSSRKTIVDSINVRGLDGKEEIIKLRGQKKATVIYVFVPTCSSSVRNLENIKKMVTMRGKSYRFLGLSIHLAGLQEFIDANKPDFPIYLNASGNVLQLGLGSVPQTIVISPGGRILKSWVGAYGENLKSEVEKYFNVRLDGTDLQGSCTYCLDDSIAGAIYSPGAVIKSGDRQLRCKFDGQWGTVN